MKKALKRHGSPAEKTTGGLRSYKTAMIELGNAGNQEVGRWANNRMKNSHLPFRRRQRAMPRYRQIKSLQQVRLGSRQSLQIDENERIATMASFFDISQNCCTRYDPTRYRG